MRILILADGRSVHTKRWVQALVHRGFIIHLVTLRQFTDDWFKSIPNLQTTCLPYDSLKFPKVLKALKLFYLLILLIRLRIITRRFSPDIVHAHYATSYGLLGALLGVKPFLVTLWGSDIYVFPKLSALRRYALKLVLDRADRIYTACRALGQEAEKYTSKQTDVTYFGVDTNEFRPRAVSGIFGHSDIVIGTVRSLEKNYGIDRLITLFAKLKDKFPGQPLKLLIVGAGSQRSKLDNMVSGLNLKQHVHFSGHVEHSGVSEYLNMMNIFVALSESEGFGVAIAEASAVGVPAVVTDVGGLAMTVRNNVTGFVVERSNDGEIVQKLQELVNDPELRKSMGREGRRHVSKNFSWDQSVNQMSAAYRQLTLEKRNS